MSLPDAQSLEISLIILSFSTKRWVWISTCMPRIIKSHHLTGHGSENASCISTISNKGFWNLILRKVSHPLTTIPSSWSLKMRPMRSTEIVMVLAWFTRVVSKQTSNAHPMIYYAYRWESIVLISGGRLSRQRNLWHRKWSCRFLVRDWISYRKTFINWSNNISLNRTGKIKNVRFCLIIGKRRCLTSAKESYCDWLEKPND